ncbi:MAG: 2-C-methyl-D-erythritol 4-phosphate cytidylyltransferase [Bacteroidales bacterium]|nr:2-C-methyl-D-erythritol 4-phosphate cytidylyltransferase [Bacteroidales bacterium]
MKNIAVILAGGCGKRFGSEEPKQFALIGGRTVLEHSAAAFAEVEGIDELCVVSHPDWIERVEKMVSGFKVQGSMFKVIAGGYERYMSSLNAIMAYIDYDDDTNLIFHDAARPNVDRSTIAAVLKALQQFEAVGVGVPATDTLWEVAITNEAMERTPEQPYTLLRVPERKRYWMAQTPQAFRLPLIRDAYQRALQDPMFQATDDCGVVARYMPEVKIHLVKGTAENIKLTHLHDLNTLKELLKR